MQGFHPFRRNETVFQKTVAINDFYLHGPDTHVSARPDPVAGTDARCHGADRRTVDPAVGVRIVGGAGRRLAGDVGGSASRGQSRHGRRRTAGSACSTVRTTSRHTSGSSPKRSASCGASASGWSWRIRTGSKNTTHQCGTLCFGTDPRASVLDPFCRTHDVENLFVVDASFFPSSAAVNPGLTIAAQALQGRRPHQNGRAQVGWSAPRESSIVQPCRHHGLELQPGGEVLLGRLRLSARRRRRHAARTACARFSASTAPQPRVQDRLDSRARRRRAGNLRIPAAAAARRGAVEPGRPDAHLLQRQQPAAAGTTTSTRKGVECLGRPERSPRGHSFFFAGTSTATSSN